MIRRERVTAEVRPGFCRSAVSDMKEKELPLTTVFASGETKTVTIAGAVRLLSGAPMGAQTSVYRLACTVRGHRRNRCGMKIGTCVGFDQLIEDGAILNHRIAKFFCAGFTASGKQSY